MRLEELELVCRQAAQELVRRARPVPPTVVLPGADVTRVWELDGFPTDPEECARYLERFAEDQVSASTPAYGFVAEGVVEDTDVVVVVFGAPGRGPFVTAAPITEDGLGEFLPVEPAAEEAFPFLRPLQRAVDALSDPSGSAAGTAPGPAGPGSGSASGGSGPDALGIDRDEHR